MNHSKAKRHNHKQQKQPIPNIGALVDAALQHHQAGRLQQAENLCRRVLKRDPENAEALHLLGVTRYKNGDSTTALQLIDKAIALCPEKFSFHKNKGFICLQTNRLEEAVTHYDQAIALQPDDHDIYNNLGIAFQKQGKVEQAIDCYQRALAIKPEQAEVYTNLGNALEMKGALDEAIASHRRALEIQPDCVEALNNLGNKLLRQNGGLDEAISCYRRALEIQPDYVQAHSNLGAALKLKGELDEAVICFRRALEIQPDFVEAHNNLGNILELRGQLEEAIKCYRLALSIRPDYAKANPHEIAAFHSNLLLSLNYQDLPRDTIFQEHLKFAEQHESPLKQFTKPHTNARNTTHKIRIGYVSADFRLHSVAFFIWAAISHHDREQFEIFAYHNDYLNDSLTAQIKTWCQHWRPIAGLSDEAVTDLIRQDEIDILVDLSGHTAGNRLLVFARKPAPVQVTWLGYPNTTGLASMDYRLTDNYADPVEANDTYHTEKLIRLPDTFICFTPLTAALDAGPLPLDAQGYVTFASFNNYAKLTDLTLSLWRTILEAVPGSKLLLKFQGLEHKILRQEVMERCTHLGICPEQLLLFGKDSTVPDHLARYNQVDIALDTFPYNGTTTTCEALWMGVPVITLMGDRHAARVGTSILRNVGLPELVANTPDEYVECAISLANDPQKLRALRNSLRAYMRQSPLCDQTRFVASLEQAYRALWAAWKRNSPSYSISQQAHSSTDVLTLRIAGDVFIAVPDSLELITPYVLREQEDWFEDETAFIRRLLQSGMNVLDIGANYGIYTLPIAKAIAPDGHLWAFEPASSTADYLQQSIRLNRLDNLNLIQAALSNRSGWGALSLNANAELNSLGTRQSEFTEKVMLKTLDECSVEFSWPDIAFIKMDAEGEEANILSGGQSFLKAHSPLIMFELKHGNAVNLALIQQLAQLGYASYRLVPGLNLLAPFNPEESLDPYQLNLFCCKEDRAIELENRGLLVCRLAEPEALPNLESPEWFYHLVKLPFVRKLLPDWLANTNNFESGWPRYERSLNLCFWAHRTEQPAGLRLRALTESFADLVELCVEQPNIPRLCMLIRIATELGQRAFALQLLNQLIEQLPVCNTLRLTEPFLPPASRFDDLDDGGHTAEWLMSNLMEQREILQAFSSYYTGISSLRNLEMLRAMGFQSPAMERRRQLIRMRYKAQSVPDYSPLLAVKSPLHLNPELWV